MDIRFPPNLVKIDLNQNPLGTRTGDILRGLGALERLREVHMRVVGLNDASLRRFFDADGEGSFPALDVLDLGDNDGLSEDCVRKTLLASRLASGGGESAIVVGSHLDQLRSRTNTAGDPLPIRLVIGKHIVKEAWELEVERRALVHKKSLRGLPADYEEGEKPPLPKANGAKEEDEAGSGLGMGFGQKEVRVRRTGFGNAVARKAPATTYPRLGGLLRYANQT